MPKKTFIITEKQLNKRLISEIQHKLKVVLKCYSIFDFQFNEETKVFKFRKSHIKRFQKLNNKKIRYDDPKEYSGTYNVSDAGDGNYSLEVVVFDNNVEKIV